MKSTIVTLSAVVASLFVANASFAAGNILTYGDAANAAFVSQRTRAEVQADARTVVNVNGEAYGSTATESLAPSTLTRAEVKKEAIEYARTHKRELAELA